MCAMQQNFMQNQQQNQKLNQQPPVQPPEPQYRFRWEIFLGIPLVIAAFFFLIKNIEPSFSFEELLEKLQVIHRTKYARLCCLAVLCLVFILAVKLFRKR